MLFGKFLLLYNTAELCYSVGIIAVVVMEYQIAINSHAVCYVTTIARLLAQLSIEVLGTCMLHQFAYIV